MCCIARNNVSWWWDKSVEQSSCMEYLVNSYIARKCWMCIWQCCNELTVIPFQVEHSERRAINSLFSSSQYSYVDPLKALLEMHITWCDSCYFVLLAFICANELTNFQELLDFVQSCTFYINCPNKTGEHHCD